MKVTDYKPQQVKEMEEKIDGMEKQQKAQAVELERKDPPAILWHGTGEKFTTYIDAEGLIPKSRLYVHLSSDQGTAKKVGARHGKPIIYQVDAKAMSSDGFDFYLSANGVWLTKAVPVRYLKKQG